MSLMLGSNIFQALDGASTDSDSLFDLNTNVYEPLVVSSTNSFLTLSYDIEDQSDSSYGGFRAAIVAYTNS